MAPEAAAQRPAPGEEEPAEMEETNQPWKEGCLLIGLEGGGTQSRLLLVETVPSGLRLIYSRSLPPANLRETDDIALQDLLKTCAAAAPAPAAAVGLAFPGAGTIDQLRRVETAARRLWPKTPLWIGSDIDSACRAAAAERPKGCDASAVILSGTGSFCAICGESGGAVRTGGLGPLLGDEGSGWWIATQALRRLFSAYDRYNKWPPLGAALLRRLALCRPEQLLEWARSASREEIAALAQEILAAAETRRERLAVETAQAAANALAEQTIACVRKSGLRKARLHFALCGGVLTRGRAVRLRLVRRLKARFPNAFIAPLGKDTAWGAALRASDLLKRNVSQETAEIIERAQTNVLSSFALGQNLPRIAGLSPTERHNPRTSGLDRMPLREAAERMLAEESQTIPAVRSQLEAILKLLRLIIRSFRRGGRLLYVGAGTSGRLGVLDASECPPTFGVPPDLIQGVIAGGAQALHTAAEGAEDRWEDGAAALRFRGVQPRDVVLAITASGTTPFVWGALSEAKRLGATAALLCCNPALKIPRRLRPKVVIALPTGPEALTGSTRLKAGTATKIVLNILSTLSLIKTGHAKGNWMTGVQVSNRKLKSRAVRLVAALGKVSADAAEQILETAGWRVEEALRRIQANSSNRKRVG